MPNYHTRHKRGAGRGRNNKKRNRHRAQAKPSNLTDATIKEKPPAQASLNLYATTLTLGAKSPSNKNNPQSNSATREPEVSSSPSIEMKQGCNCVIS